jgi:hypothetical protein
MKRYRDQGGNPPASFMQQQKGQEMLPRIILFTAKEQF